MSEKHTSVNHENHNIKTHESIIKCQSDSHMLNFTITFHPNRFTLQDSLYYGQLLAIRNINMTLGKVIAKYELGIPTIWFTSELMKNGYAHMHGQIHFDKEINDNQFEHKISKLEIRAKLYDAVYGILSKKIGNTVLKWNQPSTASEEYPTYYHYMRKDPYHKNNVYYDARFLQLPNFKPM